MPNNYDFTVIKTNDYELFCTEVKDKLNDGWQLHGNMIAFQKTESSGGNEGGSSVLYLQAMVKDVRNNSSVGFRRNF